MKVRKHSPSFPTKMSINRVQMREITKNRKRIGVCVGCGKIKENKNASKCNKCKTKSKENQQRWPKEGRCGNCGKINPLGGYYCQDCRNNINNGRLKLKKEVFAHYNSICACCGETCFDFLTIDHINGGGNKHAKSIGGKAHLYAWLKKNNYPEGFQLLCYNCNSGKGTKTKCPHETQEIKYEPFTFIV